MECIRLEKYKRTAGKEFRKTRQTPKVVGISQGMQTFSQP